MVCIDTIKKQCMENNQKEESESSKVFQGLTQQTIITIIYAVIQLLYFSVMSRLLDKEDFGYYGIISALSFILMEISNAGLGAAIIQKKETSREFINTAFTLSVLFGIFFMSLLVLISGKLSLILTQSDFLEFPLCIMACTLFFSTIGSVAQALFMKELQFLRFGIIKITVSIFSSIAGIVMAYIGIGIYSLVISIFSNFFLQAMISYVCKYRYLGFGIDTHSIKSLLSYGGWLSASGVIRSVNEQMDRLITTRWLPIVLLGAYTRVSGFVIHVSDNFNSIFDTILFPILSGIQDDKEKLRSSYMKSSDLVFLMSMVFCFSMILSSEVIIYFFLGEKWLDTATVFEIISISLLFHPFGRIGDSFFRSIGIVRQYFCVRMVVCVLSVVFISIGCLANGIIGLAFAYVCSRFLDLIIKMYILNGYVGISFITLLYNSGRNFAMIGMMFLVAFCVKELLPSIIGNCMALLVFILLLAIIALLRPKSYGETFYDYIFVKIKTITNRYVELYYRR